jgi:glucose/arabinose dehydrogenase
MRGPRRATLATAGVMLWLAAPAFGQLRGDVYVTGLSQPLAFIQDPSNARIQYVVEQRGWIRVVNNGMLEPVEFLNLTSEVSTGGERGLLGLAFAPDYGVTGRCFVNFTNRSGHTVIARFVRSAGRPLVADASTRFDFRWPGGSRFIAQPFSNHNGGTLAFGPDGYLYVGLGDGGSGQDPGHRAQNPNSLLGKMLRLDVSVPDADPEGYDVPPDNPSMRNLPVAALPEIWAFGLRNPWKFSFDDSRLGGTGALIIADVGQSRWEEVSYQPPGRGGLNYGWRNREGAHANVASLPPAYGPLTDPIIEYDHGAGQSITGGFVYRGRALGSAFAGRYFFADFVRGRVWSLGLTINPTTGEATAVGLMEHTSELGGASTLGMISAFGVDAAGELFVVSWDHGRVLRLASTALPPPPPQPPPDPEPAAGRPDRGPVRLPLPRRR